MSLNLPILFFDGECNLCNSTVNLVVRLTRKSPMHIASLQGKTAEKYLPPKLIAEKNTLVVWDARGFHTESRAVIAVLFTISGWGKIAAATITLFPSDWADGIYRWISRNRFRWFGRRATCRLPNDAEKAYFLP